MRTFDIRNDRNAALVLRVGPRGIFVYRTRDSVRPIVSFKWPECSELTYLERKFTIKACRDVRPHLSDSSLHSFMTRTSAPLW